MTQKAPNLKIVKEPSNKDSSKVSALSPREIVSELDRYVIGQHQAKRAVAVALRNRSVSYTHLTLPTMLWV